MHEMLHRVAHRGPDDEGIYTDGHVALGHCRLSVVDLSSAGHQPYVYGEEKRYVLVYNGEIYNHPELRNELSSLGFSFQSSCDTEVLATAYACWGEDCLSHLNGMFSFAVYDQQNQTLFCARDRFGVKPFYYTICNETAFAFASEQKQLLALPGLRAQANYDRLAAFLVLGELDTTEETLFSNIFQLPPGGCLRYNVLDHTFKKWQWYQLGVSCSLEAPSKEIGFEQAAKNFFFQFEDAVKLRQRSDVPVGYCLSGGLDSSAIVSISAKNNSEAGFRPQCIHSFSQYKEYDESFFAEQVARENNACLHTVEADPKLLFDELDQIVWQMDEPFGSTSVYAQWCVFRKAKELGLTVMLDGQGADEQLAGYTPFVPVWLAGFLRNKNWTDYHKAFFAWQELHGKHMGHRIGLLAHLYAWLPAKMASYLLPLFQAKPGGPFSNRLKCSALHVCMPDRLKNNSEFIKDNLRHGLQALLHYEDRNSMAFSIESRVPFLDKNFVESLFPLPLDFKLHNGESKAIMRHALKDILPEMVRCRKDKIGFVTPETEWIRSNPAIFRAELSMACQYLAPILNKKRVLTWFDKGGGCQKGDFTLWRIICAGHWAKVFDIKI